MDSNSVSLIIIVICIIMSAYFSATETAFSSLNRIRIKNMAEKGNKKAALVLKLSQDYDRLLSTILIGNNIVNIASASLATVLFVKLLGEDLGASISTIVTTIVVLIFGEVSPKSIAKESPEKFAMFSATILNCFVWILTPFNFLFRQWKKLLSKMFKNSEDRTITEEELLTIVDEAEQEGGIDEQESTLIRSAIEFTEIEAIDIFTPRVDVVGIPLDAAKEEIAGVFARTGYSRLPVYEEDIDHIEGIVYQKDFHNHIYHTEQELAAIIRPALYTTKNKKIGILLKELQAAKSHIAVVIDEFGGTVGIVTLEDILEELVGEIWDEHDKVVYEMEQTGQDEYVVIGCMNVEKLFEELDMEQEFEVVSVSGWVMEELDRIPKEGDCFSYKNLEITVLQMKERRVEKVRVKKI
ncbi:HlyC/CorC family transporter [Robinsoniella peoriensis]|uniref:Magnesium and cobalt efflux protein CorC n=1 Tax=Robinsoniella peoriensis TaxID=180332 RepID=A0A4U8QBN2_9FIRM|nr:hemolysin family protein [Robinsoniella peoriensis]MDU7030599.1 hemolysin family protein [Clostridiales bacterium]TLD02482.1 Magnesium and cobalt efflux protein CorC [Robinsoniella peoriensis]